MRLPSIRPRSQPSAASEAPSSRGSQGSDVLPPLTRGAWSSASRGSSRGSRGGSAGSERDAVSPTAVQASLADQLEAKLEAAAAARRDRRHKSTAAGAARASLRGGGGVLSDSEDGGGRSLLESSGEFGGAGLFITALGGDDDDDAEGGGDAPAASSVGRASPSVKAPSVAVPTDGGIMLSVADEERLARLMGSGDEEEGEDGASRGRRSGSHIKTSEALEERAAFLEQGAAGRRIVEIDAALERARGAEGADVSSPAANLILSRSTRSLLRRLPAEDGGGNSGGGASSKQPSVQNRRSQQWGKKALSKAELVARRKEKQKEYARKQQEKQRQKRHARSGVEDTAASSSAAAAAAAARAEEGALAVALNFDHENLMIQEIDGRISDIQASLRLTATESSVAPRGVIDRLLETVERETELAR